MLEKGGKETKIWMGQRKGRNGVRDDTKKIIPRWTSTGLFLWYRLGLFSEQFTFVQLPVLLPAIAEGGSRFLHCKSSSYCCFVLTSHRWLKTDLSRWNREIFGYVPEACIQVDWPSV
jgi:hypothetical protein